MHKKKHKFEYIEVDISQPSYERTVSERITKKDELGAFLLIHSYIVAILKDLLFYCGQWKAEEIPPNTLSDIERVNFNELMHIHLALGNISYPLFKRLKIFNQLRNELAHKIMYIDVDAKKTREELGRQTEEGLRLCRALHAIYKHFLDKRTKEILEESSD